MGGDGSSDACPRFPNGQKSMSRTRLVRFALGLAAVLAWTHGTEATPTVVDLDVLSVKAIGGIAVHYPRDWRAAVTMDGTVVALAGPGRGGVRPAATIFVTRGQGAVGEMLDSAAGGLGNQAPIKLLGERHLSPNRWARYYVRGEGATAEYVVVGVAQGHGWTVTMVGVDAVSDPWLRVHAEVLQGFLAAVVFPAP